MDWPSVGVVVPTRHRPEILHRALESIDAQAYPGPLRIVVVYDQTEPDRRLDRGGERPLTVLENSRTVGLAGARNVGILFLDGDLVAFCDDEDEWRPEKLTAQVEALGTAPDADLVTCAVELAYGHRRTLSLLGETHIGLDRLVRSPINTLRSSSFLVRRSSLVGPDGCGLFAEDAPGSLSEDWDLLLRAARRAPIEHVDEPLLRARWRPPGHYGYEYAARIASLRWMMGRHPEIRGCAPGAARRYGLPARWPVTTSNRPEAVRYHQSPATRAGWPALPPRATAPFTPPRTAAPAPPTVPAPPAAATGGPPADRR
jgi:glycosyltransferase involved in cell wall biosynthesis